MRVPLQAGVVSRNSRLQYGAPKLVSSGEVFPATLCDPTDPNHSRPCPDKRQHCCDCDGDASTHICCLGDCADCGAENIPACA
jgi:hypothetical protein